MNFRTLRRKSAWSCEINMSSDTDQAIKAHDARWRKIKVKLRAPKGLPPLSTYSKTGYYAPATEAFTRVCKISGCLSACLRCWCALRAGGVRADSQSRLLRLRRHRDRRRHFTSRRAHQGGRQPGGAAHDGERRSRKVCGRVDAGQFPRVSKIRSSRSSRFSSARTFPSAWGW